MLLVGGHPRSRVSIHRCYEGIPDRGVLEVGEGGARRGGPGRRYGLVEGYLAGVRAALEGDLAAIEDGTGASFTVGSSPTASPCHAG